MGIVNTTPDSFSDGGLYLRPDDAIKHALSLIADGADILDVGGMSTRPGSKEIKISDELERVIPVIQGIHQERPDALISIDTTRAEVASAAMESGAHIINSVRALEDEPELATVAAKFEAGLILMHSSGNSEVMQNRTSYSSVPEAQIEYLKAQCELANERGVPNESLAIDPGFGFGKDLSQNIDMLKKLDQFLILKRSLLVGLSRKSFLGAISNQKNAADRDAITHVAGTLAYLKGAHILRIHDVRGARDSLNLLEASCSD